MSLSPAGQMKRPFLVEDEHRLPSEDLRAFQEPREKRSRRIQEEEEEEEENEDFEDVFKESVVPSHQSAVDNQESFFPSDLDLAQYSQDWIYDLPQNFYLPLPDRDSSSPFPNCDQSLGEEAFVGISGGVPASSTTSQTNRGDLAGVPTSGVFHQFPPPADAFTFASLDYAERFNRNSTPSHEFDQKFDPVRTNFAQPPRRPSSLKLVANRPGTDTSFGASLQNFGRTNFQENPYRSSAFSQCNGDPSNQQLQQQPQQKQLPQSFGKLPVMQSFLDLKKSPMSPNCIVPPTTVLTLNSYVPLNSSSTLFPNLCNSEIPFLSGDEYALGSSNLAELCHHSLLQAYSDNFPCYLTEAKITVSPDTTYSPSKPNAFLPGHPPYPTEKNFNTADRTGFYAPNKRNDLYEIQSDDTHIAHLKRAETKLQSVGKIYQTADTKTTILNALMEKIKRNQSAKNLSNAEDAKPIADEKKLKSSPPRNEGLSFWESIKTENNFQQENETGFGRNRTNSYSNVTVGEADTSSQDGSRLESSHPDRKVYQKVEGNDRYFANPVTPDFFTSTASQNGYSDQFVFHLNAPMSSNRRAGGKEDPKITYLNKGQYYVLSMDCISEKLKSSQAVIKTVVSVVFQDAGMVGNELGAWKVWHNKQQSFKQRILDVDFKNSNSGGSPRGIEEMAYNATAVTWEACSPGIKVNVAVNCLSTDFSNQKGVKGIPLLIQVDSYLEEEMIHRAHCNIKVFCDKGAERKVRDEERKNKEHKIRNMDDNQNLPTSSTSPQPPQVSNFHSSSDFSKVPLLFHPKSSVPIKTNSIGTFATSLKSEHSENEKSQAITDKIILYVKEEQEKAFNALVLASPTVQGLLEAIASKYNVKRERINNLYKKSKRGILVKIDDQVIRHYGNESTYIIHLTHFTSNDACDVTLQEI